MVFDSVVRCIILTRSRLAVMPTKKHPSRARFVRRYLVPWISIPSPERVHDEDAHSASSTKDKGNPKKIISNDSYLHCRIRAKFFFNLSSPCEPPTALVAFLTLGSLHACTSCSRPYSSTPELLGPVLWFRKADSLPTHTLCFNTTSTHLLPRPSLPRSASTINPPS